MINTISIDTTVGCQSVLIRQLEGINLKKPRKINDVLYGHVRLYGNNYDSMCQLNDDVYKSFLNYLDDVPI